MRRRYLPRLAADEALRQPIVREDVQGHAQVASGLLPRMRGDRKAAAPTGPDCEGAPVAGEEGGWQVSRADLLLTLSKLAKEEWDCEKSHQEADQALLEYINDSEVTEVYARIRKWYA